ncbi:toxin glutamine deamidase domain-containing protein [Micromonospora arborensis]|uniref:toxin glutamine deamidase domain-containing protein n=1 Tax=Micromonospora arborensis TaxID=2116518 RepID=UPI003713797B
MDSGGKLPPLVELPAMQVGPAGLRVTSPYSSDDTGTTTDTAATDAASIPTQEATSEGPGLVVVPVVEEGGNQRASMLFGAAGVDPKPLPRARPGVRESHETFVGDLPLEGVDLPESALLTGVGPQSVPDLASTIRDERELARTVRRAEGAGVPSSSADPTRVRDNPAGIRQVNQRVAEAEVRADLMPEPPVPPLVDQPARALQTYPWLASVNPDGSATNCVLVAIAADMSLTPGETLTWAAPAESGLPESDLVTYQRQQLDLSDHDVPPIFRTSIESVRTTMAMAPAGSRGVLLVRDPASVAGVGASHAFNVVVRDDGVVHFLDAQRADWARDPNESEDLYFLPMNEEIGMPEGSHAVDPAELSGHAEGVATEIERSAIVVLRPGVDPNYSPVLARRRADPGVDTPYDMEVTLDQKTYFQGPDELLYPDQESLPGPVREGNAKVKFNIIEDRIYPTVADRRGGDRGRPSWNSVFGEISGVGERLRLAPRWQSGQHGLPIEVLYPPEAGWEITPDGQGAQVFVPFRDNSLYVQWNVGVPPGDGLGLAKWLASDQNTPFAEPRALLLDGIEFGREVVAFYLGVSPDTAESYLHMPEVAKLWDFMTHTYTHVSAAAEADSVRMRMLVKNLLAIGLRNPLHVVREKLPQSVRVFLEVNATAIREMWTERFREHITSRSIYRQEEYRRRRDLDSIDFLQLHTPKTEDDHPYTIGQYLDNALLDNPQFRIKQDEAVGLNSGSGTEPFERLDDNQGRLKESAVYEIRRLRQNRVSADEMDRDHAEIVSLLRGLRVEGESRERGGNETLLRLTNHIVEFLRTMSGWTPGGHLLNESQAAGLSRQLGGILIGPAHPSWPQPLLQARQQLGEIAQQLHAYTMTPGADAHSALSRARDIRDILEQIRALLQAPIPASVAEISTTFAGMTTSANSDTGNPSQLRRKRNFRAGPHGTPGGWSIPNASQPPTGPLQPSSATPTRPTPGQHGPDPATATQSDSTTTPVSQSARPGGQTQPWHSPGPYSGPRSGGGSGYGFSGAGPAGELTRLIPSHLDDGTVHEAYPWLRQVNPDRSETNCVLTAITTEMNLRPGETMSWSAPGTAAQADNGDADLLPTLDLVSYQRDQLDLKDPDSLLFRTNLDSVRTAMSGSPINSRAILLVRGAGRQVSHAFNVVHDSNGVVFLDGQAGGLARIPETVEDWILIPVTDGINPPPGAAPVDPNELTGQQTGMNGNNATPANPQLGAEAGSSTGPDTRADNELRADRTAADVDPEADRPAQGVQAGGIPLQVLAELDAVAGEGLAETNRRLVDDYDFLDRVNEILVGPGAETVEGRAYVVLADGDADLAEVGGLELLRVDTRVPDSVPAGHSLLVFDTYRAVRHGGQMLAFASPETDGVATRIAGPTTVSPDILGTASQQPETEIDVVAAEDVAETNRRLVGDYYDFIDRINEILVGPGAETVEGRAYVVLADGDADLAEVGGLELLRVDTRVPDSVPAGHSLLVFDTYRAVRHGDQMLAFASPETDGVATRIAGPTTTTSNPNVPADQQTGRDGTDTDTPTRSGPLESSAAGTSRSGSARMPVPRLSLPLSLATDGYAGQRLSPRQAMSPRSPLGGPAWRPSPLSGVTPHRLSVQSPLGARGSAPSTPRESARLLSPIGVNDFRWQFAAQMLDELAGRDDLQPSRRLVTEAVRWWRGRAAGGPLDGLFTEARRIEAALRTAGDSRPVLPMTAAANILVGMHAVMNDDRSASRQQFIDTALNEITQLRERLESLQQQALPEITVSRAEAVRHADVLQSRLTQDRLVDWAQAASRGGRSTRHLADRVWLIPPTTHPESDDVAPQLAAHVASVTALTVPDEAVVVTGEFVNVGLDFDPQPQLAVSGEVNPYLPVSGLLDLFFSSPVNSQTNGSAGENEPSVLVLVPAGTDEEIDLFAREVAEVVETRQVTGLPAPRAVVTGSRQPDGSFVWRSYPRQETDSYATLGSAVQDASQSAVPRDLATEIHSRLDQGHSRFSDYNLALLVVNRRIEQEQQEQDEPPAYRALLSPTAPSAPMESQRLVAVPLGAGVTGTGAVAVDAARAFLRVRTVLPVAPLGSSATPVRLGENVTPYRLRLPSVGGEPGREVFTLWADADEVWVNRYRVGLVAVMVPNHGVFTGLADDLHDTIGFNALEQVVVEPGRFNREGDLPGVEPYSRLRSPVDGRWLTAQEYQRELVPTQPRGLRPVVLLVDPLTDEEQIASPFVQHLVRHVTVVSTQHVRQDGSDGPVVGVAWRAYFWSETDRRARRTAPNSDLPRILARATGQPATMSRYNAVTRLAAAPTHEVSHANPAAAAARWAFQTTPEPGVDDPIAIELPVRDRVEYLRWLEQPAGIAAVPWADTDMGGYTPVVPPHFLRAIEVDSDQYYLVDTAGLAAWERERSASQPGGAELTESPDQDDSEDNDSPPQYRSSNQPGGRASTVFGATRPPGDEPPDYGLSGAGPAGEFTRLLPSHLDETTVHEVYPWLRSVNPDRSETNCVLTAITTDMNLRPGETMSWSAPGTAADQDNGGADLLPTLDLVTYQRDQLDLRDFDSRLFRTDLESVRTAMSGSPVNSRAILLLRGTGRQVSHAFNVVHDDNGVVFLDGQTGGLARTPATVEDWILIPLTDGINPPPGATVVDPNELTGQHTGMNTDSATPVSTAARQREPVQAPAVLPPPAHGTMTEEEGRRAGAAMPDGSAWDHLLLSAAPPGYLVFSPYPSDQWQHPGLIYLEQSGWQVPVAAGRIQPLPGVATIVVAVSPDLPPNAVAGALADVVTRVYGAEQAPPLRVLVPGIEGENLVLLDLADRLPRQVEVIGPLGEWAVGTDGVLLDPTETAPGWGRYRADQDPQVQHGLAVQVRGADAAARPAPHGSTGERLAGWVSLVIQISGSQLMDRVTGLHRAFYGDTVEANNLVEFAHATNAQWASARFGGVVWDVIRHGPGSSALVELRDGSGQLALLAMVRNEERGIFLINLFTGGVTPLFTAPIFAGTVRVILRDPFGEPQVPSAPDHLPVWWQQVGANQALDVRTNGDVAVRWSDSGLVISPAQTGQTGQTGQATQGAPADPRPADVLSDWLTINVAVDPETRARPLARVIAPLLRSLYPAGPPTVRVFTDGVDGRNRFAEHLSGLLPQGTSIAAPGGALVHTNDGSIQVEGVGTDLHWVRYVAGSFPQPGVPRPVADRIRSYYPNPDLVPGEDLYREIDDEGDEEEGLDGNPVLVGREPSEAVLLVDDEGEHYGLTPYAVRRWTEDNGVDLPDSQLFEDQLVEVLYPAEEAPPRSYRVDEAALFVQQVQARVFDQLAADQETVLEAVELAGQWILRQFPPDQFVYVGLGRSPAAIIAALPRLDPRVRSANLPLSAFRPGPAEPDSILATTLDQPPADPDQLAMMRQHFDEFLGDLPGDRPLVVIDIADTGRSLISVQHHLQRHFDATGRRQVVYALGVDYSLDVPSAEITAIATPVPGEPPARVEARRQWASRFRVLRLGTNSPLASPYNRVLAEALGQEAFDGLAEYGSYQLLTQPARYFAQDRPRRGTSAQQGYGVLQDALDQHSGRTPREGEAQPMSVDEISTVPAGAGLAADGSVEVGPPGRGQLVRLPGGQVWQLGALPSPVAAASSAQATEASGPVGVAAGLAAAVAALPAWEQGETDRVSRVSAVLDRLGVASATRDGVDSPAWLAARLGGRIAPIRLVDLAGLGFGTSAVVWVARPDDQRDVVIAHRGLDGRVWWVETQTEQGASPYTRVRFAGVDGVASGDVVSDRWAAPPLWAVVDDRGALVEIPG